MLHCGVLLAVARGSELSGQARPTPSDSARRPANEPAQGPVRGRAFGYPLGAAGVPDFHISGLTGRAPERTRFGRGEVVRVVVSDVNPFLFSYTLATQDEQVVKEASPVTFFNIAFKSVGIALPDSGLKGMNLSPLTGKLESLVDDTPFCPRDIGDDSLPEGAAAFRAHLKAAASSTDAVDGAFDFARRFADIQRARYEHAIDGALDPSRPADAVYLAALAAAGELKTFADTATVVVVAVGEMLSRTAEPEMSLGKTSRAGLPAAFRDKCNRLDAVVTAVDEAIARQRLELDRLRAVRDQAQVAYRSLVTTANDPASYYAIMMLRRHDKPTDVTVTVSRKQAVLQTPNFSVTPVAATAPPKPPATTPPAGSTTTTTTTTTTTPPASTPATTASTATTPAASTPPSTLLSAQRLRFGGPGRFSISAGVLYSALNNVQYVGIRQRVTPIPGQSTDTSEFVVSLGDASEFRVVPALTLNVLAYSFDRVTSGYTDGIHVVFGTALRAQGAGTDLEYYGGAGLSLLDSRFMLTGGTYAGRKQELGDLRLGQRISQSTVPVRMTTKLAWAAGITFRLY